MKNALRIGVAVACLFGGFAAMTKVFAFDRTVQGTVTRVVDGDTIHVRPLGGGATLSVRMIGMDTPETHLPVPKGRPVGQGYWGEAATRHLEKLLPLGTRVSLEDYGLDKYGRTLGRVYYRDEDVNLTMVKSGWGIPYIICGEETCDKRFFREERVDEYLKACQDARDDGRGIFDPGKALHEMPFEFRLRMQKRRPNKYVGDFATRDLFAPSQYRKVDLCSRIFFMTLQDAHGVGYR